MGKSELFNKFMEYMVRFASIKSVVALKDGFILTLPLTLVGSAFLLVACFPIAGWGALMSSLFGPDWAAPLFQVSGATFNILAILSVLGITYKYCEAEGCDAITAALLALAAFLTLIKGSVVAKSGEVVGGVIPGQWVGGNGVITAIIVALVSSWIFCYCEKHKIGLKMPEGVPTGVARAFAALVPGFFILLAACLLYTLCNVITSKTLPEMVFVLLQTPLQNLTDTLVGGIIIAGVQSILFWAGIHGPNIVGGVINPILMANALDNQALLDAGQSLVGNPQAKIITQQVTDVFIKGGGCGLTLGFLIAAFLGAKSSQMKSISRLAFVPGLFNINEPIIFGLPIVFNPYFLIPFVGVPVLAIILTYFAIAVGFLTPFAAVQVPWTTPPVIAGFLLGGWQGALVQLGTIVLSVACYFPFIRIQDKIYCAEEKQAAQEETAAVDPVGQN